MKKLIKAIRKGNLAKVVQYLVENPTSFQKIYTEKKHQNWLKKINLAYDNGKKLGVIFSPTNFFLALEIVDTQLQQDIKDAKEPDAIEEAENSISFIPIELENKRKFFLSKQRNWQPTTVPVPSNNNLDKFLNRTKIAMLPSIIILTSIFNGFSIYTTSTLFSVDAAFAINIIFTSAILLAGTIVDAAHVRKKTDELNQHLKLVGKKATSTHKRAEVICLAFGIALVIAFAFALSFEAPNSLSAILLAAATALPLLARMLIVTRPLSQQLEKAKAELNSIDGLFILNVTDLSDDPDLIALKDPHLKAIPEGREKFKLLMEETKTAKEKLESLQKDNEKLKLELSEQKSLVTTAKNENEEVIKTLKEESEKQAKNLQQKNQQLESQVNEQTAQLKIKNDQVVTLIKSNNNLTQSIQKLTSELQEKQNTTILLAQQGLFSSVEKDTVQSIPSEITSDADTVEKNKTIQSAILTTPSLDN